MMEKGFFDRAGEEEAKRILKKTDEERDSKHKMKRRQEIYRDAVMQKNKLQKTIFAAFESSHFRNHIIFKLQLRCWITPALS